MRSVTLVILFFTTPVLFAADITITMPVQTRRTQNVHLITHDEKHNVSRRGSIFGPLVIRGAPDTANRYFIDDIPVINPNISADFNRYCRTNLSMTLRCSAPHFPRPMARRSAPLSISALSKR